MCIEASTYEGGGLTCCIITQVHYTYRYVIIYAPHVGGLYRMTVSQSQARYTQDVISAVKGVT